MRKKGTIEKGVSCMCSMQESVARLETKTALLELCLESSRRIILELAKLAEIQKKLYE